MERIKIRKGTEKDLDAAYFVEQQVFLPEEQASRKAYWERFTHFPQTFFVATREDEIIGETIGGCWDKPFFTDEAYSDIYAHSSLGQYQLVCTLGVLSTYQNQGVGGLLIEALKEVGKKEKRKGLVLACKEEKKAYYQQRGFICQGQSKSLLGKEVWLDMIYPLEGKE